MCCGHIVETIMSAATGELQSETVEQVGQGDTWSIVPEDLFNVLDCAIWAAPRRGRLL